MKKRILAIMITGAMVMSLTGCENINLNKENSVEISSESNVDSSEINIYEELGLGDEIKGIIIQCYLSLQYGQMSHIEFQEIMEGEIGIPLDVALQVCIDEEVEGVESIESFYAELENQIVSADEVFEVEDKIYEPSAEIQASSMLDPIIQVGDAIVNLPVTLGDFMEQTGGIIVTSDEASKNDLDLEDYIERNETEQVYSTLTEVGSYGAVFVHTKDGSYFQIDISCHADPDSVHSICDLDIDQFATGSDTVFIAGNLHNGLKSKEVNAIVESSDLTPFIAEGWDGPDYGSTRYLVSGDTENYSNYSNQSYVLKIGLNCYDNEVRYFIYDLYHLEME